MSAVMADWHPVRSPCSRPAAPESSPTGVIKPSVTNGMCRISYQRTHRYSDPQPPVPFGVMAMPVSALRGGCMAM